MMARRTPSWGWLHPGSFEVAGWFPGRSKSARFSVRVWKKRESALSALLPDGAQEATCPSVNHYLTTGAWDPESVTSQGSGDNHDWLTPVRSWAETESNSPNLIVLPKWLRAREPWWEQPQCPTLGVQVLVRMKIHPCFLDKVTVVVTFFQSALVSSQIPKNLYQMSMLYLGNAAQQMNKSRVWSSVTIVILFLIYGDPESKFYFTHRCRWAQTQDKMGFSFFYSPNSLQILFYLYFIFSGEG